MKKRQQGKAVIQVLFRSGDIDMVDAQSFHRLVSEQNRSALGLRMGLP